jgi:hypothetical protein
MEEEKVDVVYMNVVQDEIHQQIQDPKVLDQNELKEHQHKPMNLI